MPSTTKTCKNCEKQFDASYQFCPHCGQKKDDQLTLKILFHNTVSNYFCVDARFLKSFIPLMIRPGFLPKRFVEGKRLTYLHPAQTYLFISVIFFFLFSFEVREQQQAIDKAWKEDPIEEERMTPPQNNTTSLNSSNENENDYYSIIQIDTSSVSKNTIDVEEEENKDEASFQNDKIDSLIATGAPKVEIYHAMGMSKNPSTIEQFFFEQALKIKKRHASGLVQAFYNTFPIAMFFLMPIFAFLLKIFYLNKGSFAYHMVFSFYFFSFLFVVFSVILLLNFIWKLPNWLEMLILFSTFFYLFFGIKNFYGESYFLGFIKSNIISFLFLLLVVPMVIAIMTITALMFY